jgi:hypothetical protein
MSGILKIKRDISNPVTLNDGEFYLNKGLNTVQIGSGSAILTLLPLNKLISGDIILNGNIYADNLNISSSYAETASYAHFAQTTGNVLSSSYSDISSIANTASYVLSSDVDGPFGLDSILTSSFALTTSFAPNYLALAGTESMLNPYLLSSNTASMLSQYTLNSQTSSFVNNNQTGSFITNLQTGSFLLVNQTGSMLSNYVLNSQTTSFVTNTQTGSFVTNTQTGSFILNLQTSSMTVATASFVTGSVFSSTNPALTASFALTASLALGVVGFGNLASSSYPFNVTGSTIYSDNSELFANVRYPATATTDNFIVGESAGINGYYTGSVLIGRLAGFQSTAESGSGYSTYIGQEAGFNSTGIIHSFFAGFRAGYISRGTNSIFIGREAGYNSGLSSNSIFFGRRAGYGQTNVSNSVLIGFNVGANLPITEDPMGSNNIVIGSNITLPSGYSNSINLGGIIFGSGSHFSISTGTNPNKNPVNNGRIGINIYPTNYNFEVNGTANISNGLYVTNSINLTGSNNQIGNYTITGSINSTGSNTFTGNTIISGSLFTSGSNTFSGLQTISGSLNVLQDLTVLGSASFYYFSTTFVTTSTIIATGSNSLGDSVDDVQTLIGTVNISGSLIVTGSAFLTSSNVVGGSSSYLPIWKTENSLGTSSIYQSSENVLIGTTTNANSNFKLYVSGNIGTPSFQISSISSSNNENHVGIWRPSGSQGNTHFLEATGSDPKHKWVFRGIDGFENKRDWDENGASVMNINLGWNSPDQTLFTGSTLLIDPHINVTNGNATMLRGIYYNPTISASVNTNHIAIETATGSIIFRNLPTNNNIPDILLYDKQSGQLYYTASPTGSNVTGSFTNQSTWNFNHSLNNKYVLVQTYDTNWSQIIPESITLTDINNVTITFPTSESGYAIAMLGGDVSLSNYVTTSEISSFITNSQTSSFIRNTQTGSFATTGSNTFIGNQTISGSLNITSSITASIISATDNGNGTNFKVGDDIWLGDINTADTLGLKGQQNGTKAYIKFGSGSSNPILGSGGTNTLELTGSFALASGSLTITTGSITMPNRPAFSVYGSGTTNNLNTSTNTTGTLNSNNFTVTYSQGSGFDSSTGIFTAPVAGLYQATLVGRNSGFAGGISQLAVVKNNSTAGGNVLMIEWASSSTMNHTGGAQIFKLAVNDTLRLKVLAGEINFDGNDNWSVAYIG